MKDPSLRSYTLFLAELFVEFCERSKAGEDGKEVKSRTKQIEDWLWELLNVFVSEERRKVGENLRALVEILKVQHLIWLIQILYFNKNVNKLILLNNLISLVEHEQIRLKF